MSGETDLRFEWTWSNEKLKKTEADVRLHTGRDDIRIVGFSLPQLRSQTGQATCPYAGSCKAYCYAKYGWFHRPVVRAKYERNLAEVMKHDRNPERLAAALVDDIAQFYPALSHVRLHDSGDFFARWYVQAWVEVAQICDDVVFYGYTKSLPLVDFGALPKNLRLVQSYGGLRDRDIDRRRPHARVFASLGDLVEAGYTNGIGSDLPVIRGERKIGLVHHGHRHVRPEELEVA